MGSDGGGNGGRRNNKGVDGIAGTGGGGGGGGRGTDSNYGYYGGAGGSGIVIIRIDDIDQPITWKPVAVSGGGNSGVIFVDKDAAVTTLGDDLLIAYSNTTARGALSFKVTDDMDEEMRERYKDNPPIWAMARVLLVGGGGGGGCVRSRADGAGGGGGAGGFVERRDILFDNGDTYSVSVGAGGKGGADAVAEGGDGKPSSLKKGDTEVAPTAAGGGGGGAHSDGHSGGSGGGGSFNGRSGSGQGGVGSQGNNGGYADGKAFAGGGGGGAAKPGLSPTTSGVVLGGAGGDGLPCDIVGKEVYYAGGGGGAGMNDAGCTMNPPPRGGVGGKGGGGNGAGNYDGVEVKADSGADGTGSGGGGGISYAGAAETAGDGGSGVVIIRLSRFVVKNVPVPKVNSYTFDGHSKTGVVSFFAYQLTGTPIATNADNYVVTATIPATEPYEWSDGGKGDRVIRWCINQRRVQAPEITKEFVYDSKEHWAIDKNRYHFDAKDSSCTTDDGFKYCWLTPTFKATDVDTYEFSAKLVADYESTPNVTNFVWSNSSMADRNYTWNIVKAPNEITDFTYVGYRYDRLDEPDDPHHPSKHFKSSWGHDTAVIEYRPLGTEGDGGWQAWPPPAEGSYELRIEIPEARNWLGAGPVTAEFGTWEKLSHLFTDKMEVTVSGNTSGNTTLSNFPVPVKVHAPARDGYEAFSGFSYARAGSTGKELRFFDANGDPVEHEVDTWNIYGESVLWVRVPSLKSATTKLTMCWHRIGEIRLPDYDPAGVWNRVYDGVWHFSKRDGNSFADSSGHGRDAYLSSAAKVEEIDGRMGKALYVRQGDLIADDWPYPTGTGSNKFTFSGWYRYPDFKADGSVSGGKRMFAGVKLGAGTTEEMKTWPGWALRMNDANNKVMWETTGAEFVRDPIGWNLQTTWGYLGYVGGINANGTGVKQLYAYSSTFNKGSQTGNGYYVNGSDKPLQLASAGFEVDEVRIAKSALADSWTEQEYRTLFMDSYCTCDLVHIDCDQDDEGEGLICDWWTTVPSIAKTVWREDQAFPTEVKGTYKSGSTGAATYRLLPNGEPTTTHPTTLGYYRATYDHAESIRGKFRPQPHTIDFYIIEATVPIYDIGGNGGDSGRILLMNSDVRQVTAKGVNYPCVVTNQGWCAKDGADGVTWWRTLQDYPGTNNVMPGAEFDLVRSADTNVLWHLYECRQGNTFPTNDTQSLTGAPWNSQCYLPASESTALSITNETVKATRSGTGWVLMRNVAGTVDDSDPRIPGACIYSPCYSNGVGTIYFDALNGRKAVTSGDKRNDGGYKLVLEIATENDRGEPPYDENIFWDDGEGHTNRYGRLDGLWRPVEMSALWYRGSMSASVSKDLDPTNCLALAETTGSAMNRFYRIRARVDLHKPVRFRIRRVSVDLTAVDADGQVNPDDGYILVDNVIASVPPVVAELKPYGHFDAAQDGVRAVGYGGAFEKPFPSAAEGPSLVGRCSLTFTGDVPGEEAFSLKQMFYRWRYLDQLRDPPKESGEEWKVAMLEAAGDDELRTAEALSVTNEPGDVEFYFVSILKTPYYGYVDYSGLNLPVSLAGYTEEGLPHESRYESPFGEALASGGTDWFVRLREGRSRYEGVRLLTRPAGGGAVETNAFELAGDDQWTLKLRTLRPVKEGLEFRIEGLNPQEPGSREYAFSTDCWRADERIAAFPSRTAVGACGADEWGWLACDGATGFLYFQLDLDKMAVQVAHAEAEDFSKWSSAINPEGLYVGNAVVTNASSPATTEAVADMSSWPTSVATNESWLLSFGAPGLVAAKEYPRNVPFASRYVKGWTAENAMWTYGKWSLQNNPDAMISLNDDSALQIEGRGKGRLSFTEAAKSPDGLDTVTYRARVAQYNEFDNFTYFNTWIPKFDAQGAYAGGEMAIDMTDYTFATCAALTAAPGGATLYDGDGSVSLVAYYHPQYGAYEFRVSRSSTRTGVRLALYRWRVRDGAIVCERLLDGNTTAEKRKNYFDYGDETDATKRNAANIQRLVRESVTPLGGLFVSATEKNGATLVTAGIRKDDVSAITGMEAQSGQSYATIVYSDKSDERLTRGTFGVLACNCPGVFVKPVFWKTGIGTVTPSKDNVLETKDNQTINFIGDMETADCRKALNWTVKPGRTKQLESAAGYFGFQAEPVRPQKVVVQVAESGTADWKDVYTNTVSGFTSVPYRNVVRDARKCSVRLQALGTVDDVRADVVMDDIELTQWNGQWSEHWNDSSAPWRYMTNDFVYTSAWVRDTRGRKLLRLQPTRAKDANTPVSLRSPLLRGLGLLHFSWRNADPHARIRVQYKENVSYYSIVNATETLSSGETETTDGWVDFETIAVGAIGASGSRSVYINRRYDKKGSDRNYLFGLIRIVVDRDVQAEAVTTARRRSEPEYGSVDILDAFVWDLPEYDERGWCGWNFRAAGWEASSDGPELDAFSNLKDSFHGLSGLLNNTLDESTLADREKGHYSQNPPNVQSPRFGTNCVGALSFRARLFNADDLSRAGHPAVVTVYGCNTFDAKGVPTTWVPAGEVLVSNTTYRTHTVKIPATQDFKAIRLAVAGVPGVTEGGTAPYDPPLRVAIDDICIWERLSQSVAFRKARVRPFRDATAIKGTAVVQDIAEMSEQPLIGESFGFQAEVEVLDPDEVITDDPAHPITVDLWYYAPKAGEPVQWGFENWKTNSSAVRVPGLTPATDGGGLVFRSTVDQSASLCPPQFLGEGEGYRLVQYHMVAHYYVQGYSQGSHDLQSSEWAMPAWNTGFPDPNASNASFSAFTLLEQIAPGRAWINEINYCEPTKDSSLKSQWIELAIPSGVDMTGWSVDVFNYEGNFVATLATLGQKLTPAAKTYRGTDPVALASHYAFYTIKSPETTTVTADATWVRFNGSGTLAYTEPYAFELKRPTGVIEHRVVAQGYNDVKGKKWYWTDYEGTNLVKVMRAKDGAEWTWSAEDLHDEAAANCTVSVVTNQGALHADWVSPLAKTPGDINIGQYIDPNWYILPNGGYVKIYLTILGEHMRQILGGVTNTVGDLTIAQGMSTSVVYEVDRWYKLGTCDVNPSERSAMSGPRAGADGKTYYTLSLNQVSNRIDVTAAADISDEAAALIDPKYAAYTPAIMKWLERGETGWADGGHHKFKNPNGPLVPGYYRGHKLDEPLPDGEGNKLDLVTLYWLDLDPTAGGWELWGGMGARPGSAVDLPVDERVDRVRELAGGGTFVHTNHLTSVWMELRNAGLNEPTGLSYPPYRLQGLGNEQSDDPDFLGAWTSATFKVTMCLNNGKVDWTFRPMRYFVFDPGSFCPANDPETPYAAVVEITDPFSDQSPAAEWGWKKYESESMRENGLFTRWRIDGSITPGGVSTLKKNDLLDF